MLYAGTKSSHLRGYALKEEVARAFRRIALPSLVAVISLFFSAELTFSQQPAPSKKAANAQIYSQLVQPQVGFSLKAPASAEVNKPVAVTADWSQPVTSATYYFDWGDQTPIETVADGSRDHVYSITGNHTVTVRARAQLSDLQWISKSAEANILVNWVPPPPGPTSPPTLSVAADPPELNVDDRVRVTASFDSEISTASYRFIWGDGSKPTEGPQAWAEHIYASSGDHTVTVVATILFNDHEITLQKDTTISVNAVLPSKGHKPGHNTPQPKGPIPPLDSHWPPPLRLAVAGLIVGLLAATSGLVWRRVHRTEEKKTPSGDLRFLGRFGQENHRVVWSERPGEAWSLTLKPGSNLSQHRITWMDRTESQVGGTHEQRI